MAETAKLHHSAAFGGGRLHLYEAEGGNKLVGAGPRTNLREQGSVDVYGSGKLLSKLDVTAANEGRLSLRVDDGGDSPVETVLLQAGAEDDPAPRARLVLKDAETGDSITLGFDANGPFVRLHRGGEDLRFGFALPVPLRVQWHPVGG